MADVNPTRRRFLRQAAVVATGATAARAAAAAEAAEIIADIKESGMSDEKRAYLDTITPTKEMVERHTAVRDGWPHHDAELGWLPTDGQIKNGVDGSVTFYRYEKSDRGRRVVHFADRPARVMTFGDSFTHCDQVSDGETWQEYLAAHLQEPIRNFGVGGHSVYQAYRRMKRVSGQSEAKYLVLNIWSDDHYRSLDAWRSIRMGIRGRFTLPYLRVDVGKGTFEEVENRCPVAADVHKLTSTDYVMEAFGNDPTLAVVMARRKDDALDGETVARVAEGFGIPRGSFADLPPRERLERVHTEAALFSSRCVVEMAERYAAEQGKRFLLLLSFSKGHAAQALRGERLYDETFLEWLSGRETRLIDLRDAFRADFARHKVSVDEYLEPLYNGHHTPRGNFNFAWAIKDRIVDWLEPKPLPYAPGPEGSREGRAPEDRAAGRVGR